ncbi:helix-turn-helix domain-containing protein [Umezawaea endophytica]|uniref:Helix-turn-helix transcriptional regulator n=1 Tax=Umezawaea endophytica TaxID=1654476 RepID=A0A9X2VIH7_9PSEU|nr:helix-turn-helix transcriptional regulator [Umezawaea endophytica]MCS7477176.1 helix-turn-helix transcriptional regulator [Umezawaea endophytica]
MTAQPAPIRRRKLAIRLTELRKAVPKSQVETASWTGLSQSTISKIENAAQPIEVKHVRLLAQCYGVNSPEVDQLLRMAAESDDRGLLVDHSDTVPDFARDYFELEAYAEELRVHEPGWVFGLFQTPAYIRAVHLDATPDASEEVLQRFVALRIARQERLKAARPLTLRVVLDEAVLHRAIGGPSVMAEQLAHLSEVAELPSVTLQVVPFSAGSHSALGAGFTVLRFEDTPTMDVVYVENLRTASYLEKPSDLDYYVQVFQETTRTALGPDDSRALLDTLRRTLWEQPEGTQA